MGVFFLHHTLPTSLAHTSFSLFFLLLFLFSRYFTFSCFAQTFLHSFLSSSSPTSPSLSLPTILLTLSSLQLPEEFSNDLNETPAFSIFNNPPCWIPKRTLPCTAIRKPVPGAAASAVSAWTSSLPSAGRGRGLHKVGSTVRTRTEGIVQSLRKAFPSHPGPFPSVPALPQATSISQPSSSMALFVFPTPKVPHQPDPWQDPNL